MRRLRGVIVLLSVALIGAAVLVVQSRPVRSGPVPLLSLLPSQVESIRLDSPGSPSIIVRSEGFAREWMIVVRGLDGTESRWPASEPRVRAAFRVLASLSGEASDPLRDADVGSVVTITATDGSEWRLRLAAQTLAGRGRVRVESPSGRIVHALVEGETHAMLARQSVMQWRDTRAIPGFDGTASRFRAQTADTQLGIASVRGRWGIQGPFIAPAEPRIVKELLRAAESLTVARFRDEPHTATDARPLLVIEVESDLPSPTGDERDRRVIVRRLSVLEPADASGARYLALAEASMLTPHTRRSDTISGPALVEVPSESIAALPLDPEVFIVRRAVAVPSADVGRVSLGSLVLERTHEGWVRIDSEQPVPLATEDVAGLEAVLTLLVDVPADVVRRSGDEPPEGFEQVATLSLRGLDGSDLGSFAVGVAPLDAASPQPDAAAVVRDAVATRFYRAARSHDAIAWLARRVPW
ncbi:MAG: hypothetical protein DYG93_00880 [Leptolyngbya sp. PLA2]|nr:hypothetical protein [Leptolyngbya sp. PL-A2]MCZ7632940.1 hypothetical protein [Phycisphaerales bacterium]MDL1904509.1 hypothetical protein [Synechococcales cyanobacterium CNB]GIK18985.1 MAG: hypothetical protein BroJett004_11490 [Planctomycetota bacterium]